MFQGCSLCGCTGPSAVAGWLAPDPAGCQALPCGVGVYTYIPHLFIHSSVDGLLGCLHILTTVNIVAVNIVVRVSFWISVFFGGGIYTQKWDCWVIWYFYFFEKQPYCFLQWTHQFTFSPAVYGSSLFLPSLSMFAIGRLFEESHSDRWEVVSHCGFDLCFSDE